MSRKNYCGSGSLERLFDGSYVLDRGDAPAVGLEYASLALVVSRKLRRRKGRTPNGVSQSLPWSLTAERRAELASPKASMPINDSS